jgi:DNA-binding winged helix-turn-helix (wHTH) protein
LELLIDKAPATVSREEVRCEVWGDDISIDVEQNLNYCIRQLALAFGMSLQVRRCR